MITMTEKLGDLDENANNLLIEIDFLFIQFANEWGGKNSMEFCVSI